MTHAKPNVRHGRCAQSKERSQHPGFKWQANRNYQQQKNDDVIPNRHLDLWDLRLQSKWKRQVEAPTPTVVRAR